MAQVVNFTELFSCSQTEVHEKSKNDKKYLNTVKLSVLVDQEGNLLFIMGEICYGITRDTKAKFYLYQNNYGPYMILCLENHLHGNYELLVKENCDLLVACLTEKCQVVATQKDVKKEQIITPNGNSQFKPIKQDQQEVQIGLPLSETDGKYVQMSKSVGKGMYFVGKMISKGIQTVGGFVANNVQPAKKQIKFSQNTKQNLKNVNEFTENVFNLASGAVQKLINYGKLVAIDAANQNEGIRKLEEKKTVNDLKNGATTGVKVLINLYDGMVQAGDQVKKGAFKAGGEILKKKYGVQAEEALKHVAGGVDNVVKVYKLPKDSVKYLFKVDKQQKKN